LDATEFAKIKEIILNSRRTISTENGDVFFENDEAARNFALHEISQFLEKFLSEKNFAEAREMIFELELAGILDRRRFGKSAKIFEQTKRKRNGSFWKIQKIC
jgi:hypothetical protein